MTVDNPQLQVAPTEHTCPGRETCNIDDTSDPLIDEPKAKEADALSAKDQCWMYDWIDEFELRTERDVSKALGSPTALARLHELSVVDSGRSELNRSADWTDLTLLAGEGFNLSGRTTCVHFECQKSEVDELVANAWHYFDRFVVSGPSSASIKNTLENMRDDETKSEFDEKVVHNVRILQYLRDIGASERVSFRTDNWTYCYDHIREKAVDLGLKIAADNKLRRRLVDQIKQEAKVSMKFRYGQWEVSVDHPLMLEAMTYYFDKKPTRSEIAERVFRVFRSGSIVDFVKARTLDLPLATRAHSAWLRRPGQSNSSAIKERTGRVALHLQMPTLSGLPVKELIAALDDQRPAFVLFQSALRKAIQEAVVKLDTRSDQEIADSVMRDFIEPELMRIQVGLNATKKSFSKKLATGITFGSTITTVGLLGSIPLVIGAGLAAAATVLPQLYKTWDDEAGVKTSDMYFLWRLQQK